MGTSFFEVLSILALGFSGIAVYVAIYAIRANLHQAKQLHTLYQALATLQIYFYGEGEEGEDEEWEELIQDESPQSSTSHRVIDLATRKGMTYNSETEEWEHD
jgi:hypothetical protein